MALFLTSFQCEDQPICSCFRQPSPSIMDAEGSPSRGFIAWHMGDYEDTSRRSSKRAVLLRQSKAALPMVSRPPKLPKLPTKEEVWIVPEKEMATHSGTLAWRIAWIEEPGGLQSTGSQRVGHNRETNFHFSLSWVISFSESSWKRLSCFNVRLRECCL